MNNFFLLNEALKVERPEDLEKGILNLNSIILDKDVINDNFLFHNSVHEYHNGHCTFNELRYSVVSKEVQRLVPFVIGAFKESDTYISTHTQFDQLFENCCNAFLGFCFDMTEVISDRQVTTIAEFKAFKEGCIRETAYDSIQSFWDARTTLFPNLIFCDRVWDQINHLSLADDRFKLLNDKLIRLNSFTKGWTKGVFDYKNLGLDNSPDTPTRVEATRKLRTFNCSGIGDQVFSLHIKWSFGRQFFRLYYFPYEPNKKVYIGYIGPKDDIGF